MRSSILLTIVIICYLLPNVIHSFQMTKDVSSGELIYTGINSIQEERREKREIESFDNEDYPSATSSAQDNQEEPGFWDRVVKIALKLFNRFVEWLNS